MWAALSTPGSVTKMPLPVLVVHHVQRRVGCPDVATLVARRVADDVAVVRRRVHDGRQLTRVVDLAALDEVAAATGRSADVRRHADPGRAPQAAIDVAGLGAGRRHVAGRAAEGDHDVAGVAGERVRGVHLGADRRHGAGLAEVVGQLGVAVVVLHGVDRVLAPVAADPQPVSGVLRVTGDEGFGVAQDVVDVAVALGGPAGVLGQQAGGDHVVRHDGDRPGVPEVALGGVDVVGHQALDVGHVVLVDDLLAQRVDDDDDDLGGLGWLPGLGSCWLQASRRDSDGGPGGDDREQLTATTRHAGSLPGRDPTAAPFRAT